MAALRLTPQGKAPACLGIAYLARGPHRIEDGMRSIHADQERVRARAAQPGIIGCDDDEAALDHRRKAGDDRKPPVVRRGRTGIGDARGAVSPGDDVAAPSRCLCGRDDDDAGRLRQAAAAGRRSISDAVSRCAGRGAGDRHGRNERPCRHALTRGRLEHQRERDDDQGKLGPALPPYRHFRVSSRRLAPVRQGCVAACEQRPRAALLRSQPLRRPVMRARSNQ